MSRSAEIQRKTKETEVRVRLDLDQQGTAKAHTVHIIRLRRPKRSACNIKRKDAQTPTRIRELM